MEKTINEFSSGLSEKLSHQDFRDILRLKVTELEKRGVSVSSLVISSHDGGGVFQVTFGQTSVEHISDLTKNDPDFKANLKSVYMMGCYTATTDQVVRWKNDFPSIQMVAGYDSMAPLRDATEGWNYLQDVMTLEAKIVGSKDKSKMESALKQVRDINSGTSQAIFPQCSSSKESLEFYRGKISHYRTQKFDLNYCKAAGPEFDKNWDLYKKYDSGELPIPKNTGESPLRNLYSFYRNYEFCLESGISFGPKAESVFFFSV